MTCGKNETVEIHTLVSSSTFAAIAYFSVFQSVFCIVKKLMTSNIENYYKDLYKKYTVKVQDQRRQKYVNSTDKKIKILK